MKGLVLFLTALALLAPLYNVQRKDLFDIEGVDSIYFVIGNKGKQNIVLQDKEKVEQADLSQAEGVIMLFDNLSLVEVAEVLGMKKIKEETVEEMSILYGYTNLYSDFIYIDGKQSNVQLVQKQNQVVAGFPIILSGF